MIMKPVTVPKIYQFLDTLSSDRTFENNMLKCTYEFENFIEALGFVNDLAEVVENMNHHPDIMVQYNKVTLSTTTHDTGYQVTERDFTLVEALEELLE